MFSISRNTAIAIAALAVSAGVALPAEAAYTVMLTQVGPNVVATGGGTIDLTFLTFNNNLSIVAAGLVPAVGDIDTGPTAFTPISVYTGISGPTSFGIGGGTSVDTGGGDAVGISGAFNELDVPRGYLSGSPLTDILYTGHTGSGNFRVEMGHRNATPG
jgi:hypothetical protein